MKKKNNIYEEKIFIALVFLQSLNSLLSVFSWLHRLFSPFHLNTPPFTEFSHLTTENVQLQSSLHFPSFWNFSPSLFFLSISAIHFYCFVLFTQASSTSLLCHFSLLSLHVMVCTNTQKVIHARVSHVQFAHEVISNPHP